MIGIYGSEKKLSMKQIVKLRLGHCVDSSHFTVRLKVVFIWLLCCFRNIPNFDFIRYWTTHRFLCLYSFFLPIFQMQFRSLAIYRLRRLHVRLSSSYVKTLNAPVFPITIHKDTAKHENFIVSYTSCHKYDKTHVRKS